MANAHSTPTAAGSTLPPSTYSAGNQNASTTPTADGSTLPPSTYPAENQNASTAPTADGSTLPPSTYPAGNQNASTTPTADGSTLPPSTYPAGNQNASTTPTADGPTLQSSTNTPIIQTPSEQVMRESVMLKVNNMDLEKVVLFMSVNLVVPKIDCPCWALQLIVFITFFFFLIDITGITQVASSLLCTQP